LILETTADTPRTDTNEKQGTYLVQLFGFLVAFFCLFQSLCGARDSGRPLIADVVVYQVLSAVFPVLFSFS
jgi:hypothetical protein